LLKKARLTEAQGEQLAIAGIDVVDLTEAMALLKTNGASSELVSRFAKSSGLSTQMVPIILCQVTGRYLLGI